MERYPLDYDVYEDKFGYWLMNKDTRKGLEHSLESHLYYNWEDIRNVTKQLPLPADVFQLPKEFLN